MSTTTTPISWNNDQELKNKVVALIELDKEQEKIIQDFGYWSEEEQKGCNIGCGEHAVCQVTGDKFTDRRHEYLAGKLDISLSIFYLADKIFEGLPKEKASDFVVDFWRSLPVGKDLSKISILMQIKSMEMCRNNAFEDGKAAIDTVIFLKNRELAGETVTQGEWFAARFAAWSATELATWPARSARSARSAARSAASAAESAAESAAASAAESAESAAWSAESAARSAAWSAYIDLAEYFLTTLKKS